MFSLFHWLGIGYECFWNIPLDCSFLLDLSGAKKVIVAVNQETCHLLNVKHEVFSNLYSQPYFLKPMTTYVTNRSLSKLMWVSMGILAELNSDLFSASPYPSLPFLNFIL